MDTIVITLSMNHPIPQDVDLEVPLDVPTETLLPVITEALGWDVPPSQPGGSQPYVLVNTYNMTELALVDTLRTANVVTGDRLLFGPPDAPPPAVLIAENGEVFNLGKETVIGRDYQRDVDISLLELDTKTLCSRRHASLTLRGRQYMLTDLDSQNGTYLNGERLKPHVPCVLSDGDVIGFSKTSVKMTFRLR